MSQSPKCITCNDNICECYNKKPDEETKADCQRYKSNQLILLNNTQGGILNCKFSSGQKINLVIKKYLAYDKNIGKKVYVDVLPKYQEMLSYKLLTLLSNNEDTYYVRSDIDNFSDINSFYNILKSIPDIFEVSNISMIKVYAPYVVCKECYYCTSCGNINETKTRCKKCNKTKLIEYRLPRDKYACDRCDSKLTRNIKLPKYEFKIRVLKRKRIKDILEG